ncbi:hypothetical protein BDD12DRAFT_91696 [Trichophaea hybrida]|nr:hypothetical protein BDD12DRAFT_91696 [Trichophaea hybrida]
MHHTLLCDAALALSRILTFHRIHHGFFGGFAILSTTSSPSRETKDLDVLVSSSKSSITSLLSARHGWLEIPQSREDYVAYFYKSPHSSSSSSTFSSSSSEEEQEEERPEPMVLVEMFVGHQASRFPVLQNCILKGKHMGVSYVPILDPEYLFRGKLHAAATRGKQGDALDILYLVESYGNELREAAGGMDKTVVKHAVQRHPELRRALEMVGVRTGKRSVSERWRVGKRKEKVLGNVPAGVFDVHRGLGWGVKD